MSILLGKKSRGEPRPRKKGSGRKQTTTPKYPIQQRKMAAVLDYLKKAGWNQKKLSVEVFGVNDQTFSDWVTGKREIDLRTKKTFHRDLGIQIEFWEDENLKIEEAIDHAPEARTVAPAASPQDRQAQQFMEQLFSIVDELRALRGLSEMSKSQQGSLDSPEENEE